MTAAVYVMGASLKVEQRSDEYLRAALAPLVHRDVKSAASFRKAGVDYEVLRLSNRPLWVEHKADTRAARSRNLPFELFQLKSQGAPARGWFLSSQASLLIFHLQESRLAVAIELQALREALWPLFATSSHRIVAAVNPRHISISALVSLEELAALPGVRFIDIGACSVKALGLPLLVPHDWMTPQPELLSSLEGLATASEAADLPSEEQMQRMLARLDQPGFGGAKCPLMKCNLPWNSAPAYGLTESEQLARLRAYFGELQIDNILRNTALKPA